METIHLTPSYGRDYKSRAEVLADWNAGKDFTMNPTMQYCSVRDFPNGVSIQFRYHGNRQTFIHKHKGV